MRTILLILILISGVFAQTKAYLCPTVLDGSGRNESHLFVIGLVQVQVKTQTVQIMFESYESEQTFKNKERPEMVQLLLTGEKYSAFLNQTGYKGSIGNQFTEAAWQSALSNKFIPDFSAVETDVNGNSMRSAVFKSLTDLQCKIVQIK